MSFKPALVITLTIVTICAASVQRTLIKAVSTRDVESWERRTTTRNTTPSPSPSPSVNITGAPDGLSFDPCVTSFACRGTRKCIDFEKGRVCDGGDCRCLPSKIIPCASDDACDDGELCKAIADIGFEIPGGTAQDICISRFAKQPEVCIDSKHLAGVPEEDLLYAEGRLAHVLCDKYGSCATPGHMVLYNGVGMMMKTYCGGHCVRKVRIVNMVRYRIGGAVTSKTEGLLFALFAARYETAVEERVLKSLMRFGL